MTAGPKGPIVGMWDLGLQERSVQRDAGSVADASPAGLGGRRIGDDPGRLATAVLAANGP